MPEIADFTAVKEAISVYGNLRALEDSILGRSVLSMLVQEGAAETFGIAGTRGLLVQRYIDQALVELASQDEEAAKLLRRRFVAGQSVQKQQTLPSLGARRCFCRCQPQLSNNLLAMNKTWSSCVRHSNTLSRLAHPYI